MASVFLSTMFPEARIVTVEPDLANAAVARLNTLHHVNVFVEQAAIWGDDGDVGVGLARMSGSNVWGLQATSEGQEWALTVNALDSAAGVEVNQVIPRLR